MRNIIIIQNQGFSANEITGIKDVEADKKTFQNREAGIIVYLLGKEPVIISERIPYDSYPSEIFRIKEKWSNIQKKAIKEWKAAKVKTITDLESERLEWSLKTFPEATAISSLRKLESEIKEIEADIVAGTPNPEEYADALMCLFDSAGRTGITPEIIFEAFENKLEINKSRVWVRNPDNSYSHVKPV